MKRQRGTGAVWHLDSFTAPLPTIHISILSDKAYLGAISSDYNPSIWELKQEDTEFQASLGYIERHY